MITHTRYELQRDVSVGVGTPTKWELVEESVSRDEMCAKALRRSTEDHKGYRVVYIGNPFGTEFSYTCYLVRDGVVVYDS